MNRDAILHRIRTAVGRSNSTPVPAAPPLPPPAAPLPLERRLAAFTSALELLGGTVRVAAGPEEARHMAREYLSGRRAVAADHDFLTLCGIGGIDGVDKGITEPAAWRAACACAEVGITSAEYALAATGTLVMIAGPENPRLVSLLPPAHLALVPLDRLLGGLDDLLAREAGALDRSASLVLITGTSRTADIEQILVRGVHGPGQLQVVFVRSQRLSG